MFKAISDGFLACPNDFIKLQFYSTSEACKYMYVNKNPSFSMRFFGVCYAASGS